MTLLTLELPPELIDRLIDVADREGQPIDELVARMLTEQLHDADTHPEVVPAPAGERERVRAVLHGAGLWSDLGPDARRLASESTSTLEQVEASFERAEGESLSELVLKMREPKP